MSDEKEWCEMCSRYHAGGSSHLTDEASSFAEPTGSVESDLWHEYLRSERHSSYEGTCACYYCKGVREGFSIWKATRRKMKSPAQITEETLKRLRARRCVQRVVSLRLTMSETEGLIDLLDSIPDSLKSREDVELKQRIARSKAKAVQRGCGREQANDQGSATGPADGNKLKPQRAGTVRCTEC